jgi:hypothetical protein
METLSNPFVMILFVLTMIVISLTVISIRIQKNNKIQKKAFEQNQIQFDSDYASIGVFFQGDRALVKCPSCAELISIEAKICKHCGTNVESYVSQVNVKLIQFESKRKELVLKQRDEDLKQFRKFGLRLVIILPIIVGIFVVTPIIKEQFFPTLIQKLAGEYKAVLSECGFSDVEIIIDVEPNDEFEDGSISAKGYFKSTAERKQCLTDGLNNVHENFNKKDGRHIIFNGDSRMESFWRIGNWESGSWENDYAGAQEIYTLNNEWRELSGYITGN